MARPLMQKSSKILSFSPVPGTQTQSAEVAIDVDDAVYGRQRATVYATIRPSRSAEGFDLVMVCEIPDCSTSTFERTCATAEEAIKLAGGALGGFRSRGRVIWY